MNTKMASGDDQIPLTDGAPEEVNELDTEQMEEITGGTGSPDWSGSGGDGDNPDRGHI